jgi:hypothetical protein
MTIRRALPATMALAVLAACSGQSLPGAPANSQGQPQMIRAGGQVVRFGDPVRAAHPSAGWLSKPTVTTSLLYASSYDGGFIDIFDERGKNQQPIGQLTADLVSPQGMTVDAQHRLWVANTNAFNVVAFERGSTTPFRTLNDPNYFPISVAVDSHGTVYAANAEGPAGPPGNVTVWARGKTNPTATLTYPNFQIVIGVGVDASNNVYVSYVPTSGPPAMVEFPAASHTGQPVAIADATLGDMSFDKNGDLLMETLSNSLGIWSPPYTSGPSRTIPAFGNEPTLDKKENKVWIAYANYSTPKVEGYNYTSGKLVDTITHGWTNTAIPYGVALDPALR